MSISIAWSSGCAFGMTFNKARNSGVTCIVSCWENAVNLPIFQAPSHSAFSSSRTWLSIFSSGSRQQPQLAMGIQVLGLPGCCCKSKVAMPWLDTLVSIRSSTVRSAFSQHSTRNDMPRHFTDAFPGFWHPQMGVLAQELAQWLNQLSKGRDIFPVEVQ